MNSVEFNFLKYFLPNLSFFSAKFGSLNVQIRNNLKNVIFIAYKLDGVGPVDNRPSTDKLYHFVQKK